MNALTEKFKAIIILGAALTIASCTSLPGNQDNQPDSQNSEISVSESAGSGLSALPPRTLARGECALFVWKTDIGRHFTLFAANGDKISALISGKEAHLTRISGTGQIRQGQSPEQKFTVSSNPDTIVMLTLGSVEVIESGTRYKSGVLTITDSDAWEQIIPVVGFSTCQA